MTMMPHAVAGFGVGIVVGALFFRALRLNVALYLGPGSAWRPVALHALRMLLLAAVLVGGAMAGGAGGLLCVFAGILIARAVALRAPGTTP